jgi:hypothetical protein
MRSADKLYLDVPYNSCRIIGSVCERGDCRNCSIPIVMPERARQIIEQDSYYRARDWKDALDGNGRASIMSYMHLVEADVKGLLAFIGQNEGQGVLDLQGL